MTDDDSPDGGIMDLLPTSTANALVRLEGMLLDVEDGHTLHPADCEGMLAELVENPLAVSLAAVTIASDEGDPTVLTEALCAVATTQEGRATAHHLAAVAHEREMRGQLVLQHLEESYAAQPTPNVTEWLGDLRSLQGDTLAALRLYEEVGLPRDEVRVNVHQQFLVPPAGGQGRNHPCECGSGKKYKLCHGKTAVHSLSARASRLWINLLTFLQRPGFRSDLLGWAELVTGEDPTSPKTMAHALHDDFVHDFVLFDDEVIWQFVATYAPLMSPDEVEMLNSWCESERQLIEVAEIAPMRCVVGRDLVTGERVEIFDRALTRSLQPKDLLYARLLDPGDGRPRPMGGPLSIPRMMRAGLVALLRDDAPSEVVAAWFAPSKPQMRTTDGDEMVMCTERYSVDDIEVMWGELADRLDVVDESTLQLLAEDRGVGQTVLGTVRRSRGGVALECLSMERLESLRALLFDVDPDARMIDTSTRPFEALQEEMEAVAPAAVRGDTGPQPPQIDLDEIDIEEIQQMFERRWLGENIPALGDLTPLQAAADPQMREELLALLDDFEWQERRQPPEAIGMRVAKLREALGI